VGERFHKYSTFCRHQDRYLFIPYAGQQLLRSCFHGQYKALELLRTTALCCFNDDQGNKSSMQVVLHPDSVLTTKYSVNQILQQDVSHWTSTQPGPELATKHEQ